MASQLSITLALTLTLTLTLTRTRARARARARARTRTLALALTLSLAKTLAITLTTPRREQLGKLRQRLLDAQAESAVEKMLCNEARAQQSGLGLAMGHGALT